MECLKQFDIPYFNVVPEPIVEEVLPLESLTWIEYVFGYLLSEFVSDLFWGKIEKRIPQPKEPPTFYHKLQNCWYGVNERKKRQIREKQDFHRYRIQQSANAFIFYMICCVTLLSIMVVYSMGRQRFVKLWETYLDMNDNKKEIRALKKRTDMMEWLNINSYKFLQTELAKKLGQTKIEMSASQVRHMAKLFTSIDNFDEFIGRRMESYHGQETMKRSTICGFRVELPPDQQCPPFYPFLQQCAKIHRLTLMSPPIQNQQNRPGLEEQIGDCGTLQK